jgi:dienelactone hydrolase
MLSRLPQQNAATVFVFALDIEGTLGTDYGTVGQLLAKDGYLGVSLDVPGHGEDADPDEPNALLCWRRRFERGEDPIADFTSRVSGVLDYLIAHKYTDRGRIAATGTSRGGFLAAHVTAADERICCAAPIAPVADLMQLTEFKGVRNRAAVEAKNLVHLAQKLANRSIWVTIGNNDERVNTDSTIAFTRSVVASAVKQGHEADVELHVVAEAGHVTPKGAHQQAAAWMRANLSRSFNGKS